ncbi:ABC transporter ATP-binding protein, partial [Streptomyces albiflaviniger]|nr:ABC transporter ATP-binding protein [Streptomyces albiflaviniger]
VVLHLGKVLAEGAPTAVVRDEKVIAAYLGDRHRAA